MSLAGAHGALGGVDHMAGAMGGHVGQGSSSPVAALEEVLAMCLAVAESSALALAAGVLLAGSLLLQRRAPFVLVQPTVHPVPPRSALFGPWPRAGPTLPFLLQVIRW